MKPIPTELIHGRPQLTDTTKLYQMAHRLANSELCPKQYQRKPDDCLVAILAGAEVGFQPMTALKSIAVINGRPSIYGDGLPAIAYASGKMKSFSENFERDKQGNIIAAVVRIERSDVEGVREFRFSVEDAKEAQLWGKAGPWKSYKYRMLQMRARGYAFRDCFADYLGGLHVAEEQADIIAGEVVAQSIPPDREISFEDEPEIVDAEYQVPDATKMTESGPYQQMLSTIAEQATESDLHQLTPEIHDLHTSGQISDAELAELLDRLKQRRAECGKGGLSDG